MTTTQISHDGFARTFTYRETVPSWGSRVSGHNRCAECGRIARFRYTTQCESRTCAPRFAGPAFCSISCWRSYSS